MTLVLNEITPIRTDFFFNDFRTVEENNTNEVKDSVIFFTNQYLIYQYIVIVPKSRGFAIRLTDF